MKTCTRCGLRVEDELTKCNWCGCTELGSSDALRYKEYKPRHEGYYLGRVYGFAFLSALIAFVLRLFTSGVQEYYDEFGLFVTEVVKGIPRDLQLYFMPHIVGIASFSVFFSIWDRDADLSYRLRAIIISTIFIALAIYAILYETPVLSLGF
ncbi:MAG: hypothetical protein IJW41_04525 [Oscillospiraceae bacterium]|nr:hypothetical protein [Oscillospiraceae bacterium]